MKVTVHRERCISSGNCVLKAPNVFELDAEGVVVLRNAKPAAADHALVREAAAYCPVVAIEVAED